MLQLYGRSNHHCDRVPRRDFLTAGSLVFGGLTLADALRVAAADRSAVPASNTAVIQLFCGGGPSQLDTYDLKPHAPAEIRGEFREIPTNVPGIRICEHLPLQAAVMDKLAIVRTVSHTNSSHLPSSHLIQTGYLGNPAIQPGTNEHPSTGSITARIRGTSRAAMPAYVAVPRPQAFALASYLGPACNPFTTEIDPNAEDYYVPNLAPRIDRTRIHRRRDLVRELDRVRRRLDATESLAAMDGFRRQALEMLTSPAVAAAFDITREPDTTRDRYGRTSMGQNLLLARRLVEAGVSFVSCLSGGGWDTHVDNFKPQRQVLLPRLDRAVSALVSDLAERGLSDRVLVNVMGEFGRTPTINKDAGRDHWPGTFCAMFAGGGLKMGQMIGTTDSHAAYPTSRPYSPGCVLATIYHVLGIDTSQVFHDHVGRPFPILKEGEPIAELL